MKLLLDQDIYEVTIRFLKEIGQDILKVSELGMATAEDKENLNKAAELGRIFVTRDRGYGNLVYVHKIRVGVLYLRMLTSNRNDVHKELSRVLNEYSEDDLRSSFVVVEAGRHRFRRI